MGMSFTPSFEVPGRYVLSGCLECYNERVDVRPVGGRRDIIAVMVRGAQQTFDSGLEEENIGTVLKAQKRHGNTL